MVIGAHQPGILPHHLGLLETGQLGEHGVDPQNAPRSIGNDGGIQRIAEHMGRQPGFLFRPPLLHQPDRGPAPNQSDSDHADQPEHKVPAMVRTAPDSV